MPNYLANLTVEQMTWLKNVSKDTGIPIAHFVRTGIDLLIGSFLPYEEISGRVALSGYVFTKNLN